jgi:hypothetical protein
MSEWFKEAVLKTVVRLRWTVGSNPTPSAREFNPDLSRLNFTSGLCLLAFSRIIFRNVLRLQATS